jgi:hypothetical protein
MLWLFCEDRARIVIVDTRDGDTPSQRATPPTSSCVRRRCTGKPLSEGGRGRRKRRGQAACGAECRANCGTEHGESVDARLVYYETGSESHMSSPPEVKRRAGEVAVCYVRHPMVMQLLIRASRKYTSVSERERCAVPLKHWYGRACRSVGNIPLDASPFPPHSYLGFCSLHVVTRLRHNQEGSCTRPH